MPRRSTSSARQPIFGYTDKVDGYPYDPDKAQALIKEAGAEGAKLEFLTSPSYNRRWSRRCSR